MTQICIDVVKQIQKGRSFLFRVEVEKGRKKVREWEVLSGISIETGIWNYRVRYDGDGELECQL